MRAPASDPDDRDQHHHRRRAPGPGLRCLASGAGAEGRIALGLVIIGGMSLATLLTLLVLPPYYYALARFTKSAGTLERRLREQEDVV